MGGLRKSMPITFITYLISTLAIAGIAPLSGYYSKHAILAALEHNHNHYLEHCILYVIFLANVTAFLTAFYMTRSVAMTFFGEYRGHAHPHESPFRMTIPLIVLALLAAVGGFLPLGEYVSHVLPFHAHHHETFVESFMHSWVGLFGVLAAFTFYTVTTKVPPTLYKLGGPLSALSKGKFFLDEVYGFLIVRPLERMAAFLWHTVDQGMIDGTVNGTGALMEVSGEVIRTTQTGQLRHYAFFMFLATVVLTFFYLVLR